MTCTRRQPIFSLHLLANSWMIGSVIAHKGGTPVTSWVAICHVVSAVMVLYRCVVTWCVQAMVERWIFTRRRAVKMHTWRSLSQYIRAVTLHGASQPNSWYNQSHSCHVTYSYPPPRYYYILLIANIIIRHLYKFQLRDCFENHV